MVFTYSNANVYIRYLCNSIRFPIVVFAVAVFRTELPLQLGEFASSVCFVAIAVLPLAGLHVGEIISKAIMNMVAYILGALLGYGLRTFSEKEIGTVFLLAILFILIALGIFVRSVIKKVKDGYDYIPTAFLMAMFSALVYPLGPGCSWLTNQFDRNIKTLVVAYALTILSVFVLPFFAGDEVHNGLHKNISTLADIFKDLNEKCFGEKLQNLQDKLFLQKLQSLIDSNEKSKFRNWEPWWHPHPHPQEQYEKIGDLIRHCALTIRSLFTTVENLHFSTHLRDTCKEISSESEQALTLLSDSMKDKTAPKPSIDDHLTAAQDLTSRLTKNKLELTAALKLTSHPDYTIQYTALKLESHPNNTLELTNAIVKIASHPENMLELNVALNLTSYLEDISHITSHLVTSVKIIKRLASSIKELSDVVPFKQCEQDSNVPKRFIPGIHEMATRAKQLLVAPMKNMASRLFAYLKKLITKCSFASNAPDTIQAPVNLVPLGKSEAQREEVAHVTIDINPPAACCPNLS